MQRNNGNNDVGSHVHPACAACKHQRKKCDENCVLAPYFPANKSREFQAVHKVFGVANVQKIVKFVGSDGDRRRVADSLIWEALCRQKDPILGPYGEYKKLLDELRLHKLHNLTQASHVTTATAPPCKMTSNNSSTHDLHHHPHHNHIGTNNTNDFGASNYHVFSPSSTYSVHHPEKLIKQESQFQHQSASIPAAIAPLPQFYYSSGIVTEHPLISLHN